MKQFIAKRKIRVPRYKLYYFVGVGCVIIILLLNLVVPFFFKHINQEGFLSVLVGNSFGNITEDSFHNWSNHYLFYNSFGIPYSCDETVIQDHDSLEDIVLEENIIQVYLYNTFQTDQYKNTHFSSYSINSYVTQASLILKEYLEDYHIGSIVEEESVVKTSKENNIPYSNSYAASKILMENASSKTTSLKYFFDLQVSDYEREATTTLIDDVSYAKILFVVGTDNSNYEENQNFAIQLNDILNTIEPSLSRGVSLRGGTGYQGVYNQDFSKYTLLIQVGGIHNTIDEVNRSLKVLANVIANFILEEENEEK